MKILQKIFKKIEQKSKLDLITELLTVQTSTPDAMELFEKVKINFYNEMRTRQKRAAYDCRLIAQIEKPINQIKVY